MTPSKRADELIALPSAERKKQLTRLTDKQREALRPDRRDDAAFAFAEYGVGCGDVVRHARMRRA